MVQQTMFFLILAIFSLPGFAQDERYYRQILAGELPKINEEVKEKQIAQFNVTGSQYRVDLNGDKLEEIIEPQKRDGVDWLEVRNASQNKLFEAKLLAMGTESTIYKIKVVSISKTVKACLLFLDEGRLQGRRFEATARIYVLSFENNDLSTLSLTEGPHFFHEKEAQREQYWRRDYSVNVHDINGDGIREISVQYNHIQRIMKYSGKGIWERF